MIDDLIRRQPATIASGPVAAIVTQVSGPELFVVPVGADRQYPLGPCRGMKTAGGNPLPVGAHVLVVFADNGPWITAVDE